MPAGIGTALVIGGFGWLLLSLFGSDEAGGGGTPTGPGGGSGGGGSGTGGDKPGAPKKPIGGGGGAVIPADIPTNPPDLGNGGVWGDASKIPADFDWNGNGWWVANDCTAVAVARGFAPATFTALSPAKRQTITTLQSVTQIGAPPPATGTLWNYLFHLAFDLSVGVAPGGGVVPEEASANVLQQMNALCFDAGDWPGGFADAMLSDVTTFYEDQIEPVEGA